MLVTGSSGFVGQHLTRYLEGQGHEIYSLNRYNSGGAAEDKSFLWKSFGTADMDRMEVVIHLAGKAHDLQNTTDPEEYFKINTGLSNGLFQQFLQSEAKDFIYFSSVKAVADRVEGVLREEDWPDPQTPYGQSKRKAEEFMLSQTLPEGKRLFILRPCMIHGPGNKGNLNALYKTMRKGIPYPLAGFANKRSFLSVENLCFIILQLTEDKDVKGGIYQLADDEALSTTEVIGLMGMACDFKPRLWTLSPELIKKVAAAGDVLRLPLNSERLKKLTENYVVDNRKIKEALKTTALPVSAKEGLRVTFRSFQK